ncbi:hypothetical protein HXX76_008194 [Chlamydomonas incerta]|uniref:Uncharacterized protein n=1 Tax=Chlamydomonas incerta TaxID=51695 RepID=A0A835SVH7_CHLIN|nr:hypothetical protein HXX76_008194 [Chlamydomonas incerta]|eukprot:KAG2433838.1 hypothetical protein HXX76_008194 [Chlamydomonas incerta]
MSGRALLSRYRSTAGLSLPRASPAAVVRTGNPVQEWDEAACYRVERLADFMATQGPATQAPGGSTGTEGAERLLRTSFWVWDGPLAGIAHVVYDAHAFTQEGQFEALDEGPAGEAAARSPPPDDLAEALAADLEALLAAARAARHVVYDIGGSESDFGLLPLILEPARHGGGGGGGGGSSCQAAQAGTAPGAEAGGGGWWSAAEAVAAPLTWGEVAASLGVAAPELVAALAPPPRNVFHDRETFWSSWSYHTPHNRHMWERHISPLGGGATREGAGGGGEEGAGPPPPLDSPAAVEASAAAAAAAGGGGAASDAAPSPAAAMADAVRRFLDAVQLPSSSGAAAVAGGGPSAGAEAAGGSGSSSSGAQQEAAVLQVFLGSEALGWNPIPLLWLGRSRRSGAILGLMTAVVWT